MLRELPKVVPSIVLRFEEPRNGYWDGGVKSGGRFTPHPCSDGRIEWGSWGLNFWFRFPFGHSWKDAANTALRRIKKECRVPCTVEIEWE
jgi:hypothetical protein